MQDIRVTVQPIMNQDRIVRVQAELSLKNLVA